MHSDHDADFTAGMLAGLGHVVFGPLGLILGTLFFSFGLIGTLVTGRGLYNLNPRTMNTRAEAPDRYWFEVARYAVLSFIYVGLDVVAVVNALAHRTI
jgi:hypothetical protein